MESKEFWKIMETMFGLRNLDKNGERTKWTATEQKVLIKNVL